MSDIMDMEVENDENNIQQDLCRLCNCECDENGEMFSIFDKNEDGIEILQLIQESLLLIVQKNDTFSKSICADCLENLNALSKFKKRCEEIDSKRRRHIKNNGANNENTSELSNEEGENDLKNGSEVNNEDNLQEECRKDVETSTEGLITFCSNCQSEILDAHKVDNEIELRAELHQAIAESFTRNKIVTSGKVLRSKRKRSQAFYHELDDSLCSSLTEFTNTESSQCFEFQSDEESLGKQLVDEDEEQHSKKRKTECVKEPVQPVSFETQFEEEEEYIYNPSSLLKLCLKVMNEENIPGYMGEHESVEVIEPVCNYCSKTFRNRKLLALHEVGHLNVELGEKVDNPMLWHESRDDADIRNKWLTSEDDVAEEENDLENETMMEGEMDAEEDEESLLIPVRESEQRDGQNFEETREVTLIDGKPFVDGLPLSDYAKEERRAFYHSMRVGGVNKRFCPLCRYSFKDNWAIESHYFSMACYYTCRYCGMRFNKQRNRYDEHVDVHVKNKDEYSTKVFAASKNSYHLPKVIYPKKRYQGGRDPAIEPILPQPIEIKHFVIQNKKGPQQPEVKVKQEPVDYNQYKNEFAVSYGSQQQNHTHFQTSQSKTGNQAYFCRKCYKVFFKLDEFNVHSKNCDYNQSASNSMLSNYLTTGNKPNGEPTNMSSSGRPLRTCAREAGPYRDEVFIPEHILKDQVQSSSQGPFVCYICNTPFPTVYSRNSHMRIHKSENMVPPSALNHLMQQKPPSYQEPLYHHQSVAHLAEVKQEPMDFEPEVEIHEPVQENFTANLSPAVSITPISKKPNQKLQINPSVMKLVQNNPQLSIRNRDSSPHHNQQQHQQQQQQQQHHTTQQQNIQMQQHLQQMLAGSPDTDRTYKCSSCWESFANKSHLYFHKKNQCEGSKYPCPFCKKRFGTEAAYSSHIFYSHPE